MTTRTIECKAGHTWDWEVRKGKVPAWCPEHRPVKEVTRVIHCQAGHDWTWEVKRGRVPGFCPEHHPSNAPQEPQEPAQSPEERLELARQAKAQKAAQKLSSIDQQVEAILAKPNLNPDLKLKLQYAHSHVSRPGMVDRRRELIREATRGRA